MQTLMKNPLKLKRDENQPRQYFDEEKLQSLADSFSAQGVINPIEIDDHGVIVTGERRWRAAKLAGLKKIPCRVVNIPKNERLLRQTVENMHFQDLSDMEQARTFKELLCVPGTQQSWNDAGIRELARTIGVSERTVREKLSMLEQPKSFQKKIESGEITGSMVRAVNQAPEEYKKPLRDKIMRGEVKTRDGAIAIAKGLKRAKKVDPELAEEILKQDYSHDDSYRATKKVVDIVPTAGQVYGEMVEKSRHAGDTIKEAVRQLNHALCDFPFEIVSTQNKATTRTSLLRMKDSIENYLNDKEVLREA